MSQHLWTLKKCDLEAGSVSRVEVSGKPLAVYNLDGTFYATDDGCTHATASLSEGEIVDDDCIACPVHNGTFHIPTGQAMSFPCEKPLRTYKVVDQGDSVVIDIRHEADAASDAI